MKTKTKLTNRILSLVLAFVMVMGMLPLSSLTALAADATYDLWVGGEQFTSEKLTITDSNGGTAEFDPGSNTLTLTNYNFTGAGYDPNNNKEYAAIYYEGSDTLNLVLEGTSSITQQSNTKIDKSYGIFSVYGSITVSGNGSLTANGSDATDRSCGVYIGGDEFIVSGGKLTANSGTANNDSWGLSASGSINISDGTIEANSGSADESRAMDASTDFTVSGGSITATGGNAKSESYGILVNDNITVLGGNIVAIGGDAGSESYGVKALENIAVSGGTVKANAGTASTSVGMMSHGSITISGGSLTAIGGDAGGSYSMNYGVYAYYGITVLGGRLEAVGESYGVYNEFSNITISGGETVAQGKTQAFHSKPIVDSAFKSAAVWSGANETSAIIEGEQPIDKLEFLYIKKYVKIAEGTSTPPAGSVASMTTADGDTTKFYTDFNSAIREAKTNPGSTLKLLDNIVAPYNGFSINGIFTIDLNGFRITADRVALYIWGGDITFTDTSEKQTGGIFIEIEGEPVSGTFYSAIEVPGGDNAHVTIEKGTYSADFPYGCAVGATMNKVTIKGGNFIGEIFANYQATIDIHNGSFSCKNGDSCILFAGDEANVTISDGTFTYEGTGAALETYGGNLTVSGGTIESDSYDIVYSGGTLDLSNHRNPAGITIYNFSGNVATVSDTIKLPADYVLLDGNGKVAESLAGLESYTVGVAPPPCDHSDSKHTTATDNTNGTHSFTCTECGTTVTEDHTYTENAEGKFVCVCDKEAVAKVGDVIYNDFATAVNNWTDGTTLTLLTNVEHGTTISLGDGTRTFDGGKYTLTLTGEGTFLINSGELNIAGGTILSNSNEAIINLGTLNISGGTVSVSQNDAYVIVNHGNMTLKNGNINGRFGIENYGTATLEDGTVTASEGYALYNWGTAYLSGADLIAQELNPALICKEGSETTISGGTLSSEERDLIRIHDGSKLTFTDTTDCDGWKLFTHVDATVGTDIILPADHYMFDGDKLVTELRADWYYTIRSHKHTYSSYINNGDTHYGKCECGAMTAEEKHTLTYSVDQGSNTITASCNICHSACGSATLWVPKFAYYTNSSAFSAQYGFTFKNGEEVKLTYDSGDIEAPSGLGKHTATLTVYKNGEVKASVSAEYEITYLPAPQNAYSLSGGYQAENTYWLRNGAAVTVNAPEGFKISKELDGTYEASVSFSQGDNMVIYLKDKNGAMTDAINVTGVSFDENAPTGKITVTERNFWEKLLNKITFGLFFKGDAVATVTATDNESGVNSTQYYLANEDLIGDDTLDSAAAANKLEAAIGDNWENYNNEIALNKNAKYVIYVKITDNVGNVTYVSSNGIVLYSDAEAVTLSVTATYKAGEDKDISVKLNGNTVNAIKNGDNLLTAGTDYSVSDDKITLKADYLDTLSVDTYTFTVSYNPMGVGNSGVTDLNDTTFSVKVEPTSLADATVIASGTFTYDGSEKTPDIEVKLNGESLVKDQDYTVSYADNVNAGAATVTVSGRGNYEGTANGSFEIKRAELTNVSVQQNGTLTYDGGKLLTPKITVNATALNGAKVLFMYSADGNSYGEMPTFTKAGTYTVYYQAYTTDNNFIDQHGAFTVTIDKAIVTEPTIASKPYNGSVQKADISDTDLYTVEENNGGTVKGSYGVALKLKDADNYMWASDVTGENETVTLQFVISAAQNAWDIKPAINGWTYGQSANAPTYEAKFGTVQVVYSGKANDGTDYNSETAPTKAGGYTATFTVEGTEDYSGLSEQVSFTIAKKDVTVTANDASKTYGDSDPAFTYTHTELVGSDALDITVARASGETVNTYTITASQAEGANPNYEITFKTGTFTIQKAALTVTVEDKTATYGDAVPNYTVKYEGFKNGDYKDDLGGTLAFDCDYAQFSDKGEYTVKASGYTSGNYTISYVDGKLTVNEKPITVTIQNATSIYGEALAELKATDNGIVNGDKDVYSLATVATSTSNVGKYAITGTALDSNYDVTFENGEYEITKREITITVEAKNTIVNTALPTYTYKVEGLVGEDKLVTEPTLTSDADITVIGEYDITAIGADAGDNYSIKYVPAKLTVLTDDAVDAAAGYTEELKDYDPKAVTSEDKAELDEILDEINTILDDENITDNGKKALEEVKEQIEKLIKEITDAADASDTENTEKVENVTPENVTPENKTDLEKAKEDLEKALDEHGSNMTEDEKKAIEDELGRIEDALEVIGNVEAVEELIDKLPNTIKKDDEAAIKAAEDAYNALSDYEKSLVDKDAKKALDDAKAALAELNKPADPNSPTTGDNSNMFLWIALLFISGGAVITLTVVDRKRRTAAKK